MPLTATINNEEATVRNSLRNRLRYRCPIHQAVLGACADALVDNGYFKKQNIIEELDFTEIERSIRWDFISEFLRDPEDEWNLEMVPLAPKFFIDTKLQRDATPPDNLAKYLAGGHGRKTAGYASVDFERGRLAVRKSVVNASIRNGVGKALDEYKARIHEKNQDRLSKDDLKRLEEDTMEV